MELGRHGVDIVRGLAGELAGWVSSQFALLPLRATNAAVSLNTKALEAQAKMGLEAAKVGTELMGMGVKVRRFETF